LKTLVPIFVVLSLFLKAYARLYGTLQLPELAAEDRIMQLTFELSQIVAFQPQIIYNFATNELTPSAVACFKRIFWLSDFDKDGTWAEEEFYAFSVC